MEICSSNRSKNNFYKYFEDVNLKLIKFNNRKILQTLINLQKISRDIFFKKAFQSLRVEETLQNFRRVNLCTAWNHSSIDFASSLARYLFNLYFPAALYTQQQNSTMYDASHFIVRANCFSYMLSSSSSDIHVQ